jgi:hypothetical protein
MSRFRLTEPVRLYLYGIAVAAIAAAIGLGLVTESVGALIAGLVVAVLAVPTTEVVRASVYAPATVERIERTP